jgi:hypothetical protein
MVTEATVEGEVGAAREEEEPESEQLSSGRVVVGQRPWAALVPRHDGRAGEIGDKRRPHQQWCLHGGRAPSPSSQRQLFS